MRAVACMAGGLAIALQIAACGSEGFFACAQHDQCGADGRCEPDSSCSFPDTTCDSGRRYGDQGDPAVAGLCVPVDATTGEPPDPGVTSPSTSGDASSDADTLALDEGPTTSGATMTSAGSSSGEPPGSSSGDGVATTDTGSETGEPLTEFFDDFERPDADAIGNGWWEKSEAAFQLVGGQVLRSGEMTGYADNLVLRPDTEILGDVEIILVVHPMIVMPPGNPQIHARVQPDDVDSPGDVTGYILYVNSGPALSITRQESGEFAMDQEELLATPLSLDTPYRLRLVVTGQDPVQLDGYLEVLIGARWEAHTEIHIADADPTRIADPGLLGFSADTELEHFTYDDFSWTAL